MVKKKRIALLLSGFLLAGVAVTGVRSAMAYLTDYNSVVNTFKEGNNTTNIDENFPSPTPIPPGGSQTIAKLVQITNDNSDGNSVPCYVRAKVYYSTSDMGNYTIQGMGSKWVLGTDDYYYYTDVLEPGKTTEPFMKSVKIDGSTVETNLTTEIKNFDINVYEESYQAKDPDTQELMTWQQAWSKALNKTVTAK